MDESTARSHIEAHAAAVVSGDQEALLADFPRSSGRSFPSSPRRFPSP
jgi:hypothetical protein